MNVQNEEWEICAEEEYLADTENYEYEEDWDYPLFEMMAYCRAEGVVPNITINGDRLTDALVQKLADNCGAISVSRYDDKDVCYNAVKRLKDAGVKQKVLVKRKI